MEILKREFRHLNLRVHELNYKLYALIMSKRTKLENNFSFPVLLMAMCYVLNNNNKAIYPR